MYMYIYILGTKSFEGVELNIYIQIVIERERASGKGLFFQGSIGLPENQPIIIPWLDSCN